MSAYLTPKIVMPLGLYKYSISVFHGNFETPMGELEKEEADTYTKHCDIKRFGHVYEIASLFAYCASSSAGYLTGVDILCDD
jgi:NAD(P)-dependent dehydrogenase (short-subunit alcohol dehydrogenase family)